MFKYKIEAMAFSRNKWIERIRDRHLGGALGEYAKLYFARQIGYKVDWSEEIIALLLEITEYYMNPEEVQTSGFSRIKALKEAIKEASFAQFQITEAKNELIKKHSLTKTQKDKLLSHKPIKAPELMKKMLEDFAEKSGLDKFLK